ncbi:MAG TPA: hypothetical protein VML75_16180 [Kofleriaceae bacterium]|nr:hypothetical protein [Kofleriaceae bacterium]
MVGALAVALAPACGDDGGTTTTAGDGDGDGDGDGGADATVTPDAPPAATEWGQICDGSTACPSTDLSCVAVSAQATQGWCTVGCGSTAWDGTGSPTAPVGGDALCASSYYGTTPTEGTGACAIYAPDAASPNTTMADWSCAILCGVAGTTDYGGCPTGMTCTSNLCQ